MSAQTLAERLAEHVANPPSVEPFGRETRCILCACDWESEECHNPQDGWREWYAHLASVVADWLAEAAQAEAVSDSLYGGLVYVHDPNIGRLSGFLRRESADTVTHDALSALADRAREAGR